MKTFNYDIKYGVLTYCYLDELLKLTDEQKEKLREKYGYYYRDNLPFDILVPKKYKSPSFWWRLSFIPFIIINIMLLIFTPIKYLIFGKQYYDIKYFKWFFEWGRKIKVY